MELTHISTTRPSCMGPPTAPCRRLLHSLLSPHPTTLFSSASRTSFRRCVAAGFCTFSEEEVESGRFRGGRVSRGELGNWRGQGEYFVGGRGRRDLCFVDSSVRLASLLSEGTSGGGRRLVGGGVWSSRSCARGGVVVGKVWASSFERAAGGGGQAHLVKSWRPSSLTGDITGKGSTGRQSQGKDDSPGSLEEEQSRVDPLKLRVKGNLDKGRSKYKVSRSTETKVHSSNHPHQFSDCAYTTSVQTHTSVTLQGVASTKICMDKQDPKMHNGRTQKRPPNDQLGADASKSKKKKNSEESGLRRSLDMCSKYADVMQALGIYDKVVAEGIIVLNQYHYNVLLYLCSSAATGSLKQGKSGNENSRSSGQGKQTGGSQELDGSVASASNAGAEAGTDTNDAVKLTEEQKDLCLKRGFEIYEAMKLQGVSPNEATLTAVARLAVAKEDGDLAFEMVKQMEKAKLAPRLRSYGPALFTYCNLKLVDKAFEVDEHMKAAGVCLEESELEALLKLSVNMGLEDKVYSLLHRLRTTVRELSPSTVKVIQDWFESDSASNAGKATWETLPGLEAMKAATESCGGGWHGLGWLGKGEWVVKSSALDKGGVCHECGEQLVTIDIDPRETEMFSESLSKLACQREAKNNEFKKFQAWLDRNGPFDVIVDGANVGLYNQNFGDGGFNYFQLNSVVDGIKKKLGSKREPLILLHHRRTKGGAAASPFALKTLSRWQETKSIYTTPTGSNDDWYWLYAAVRYKCILVTNDEMRDHLFQLLGTDFFPKWKERHQVRFSLSKEGPVYHMPPPYSILIQESEKGAWHIPKSGGDDISSPREWLCVTRTGLRVPKDPKENCNDGILNRSGNMCNTLVANFELKELSSSVKEAQSSKKVRSPKSSTKVAESQDHPASPTSAQSPTRKSRSPKSPTTLQRIKAAEKKATSESPVDFQI